MHPLLDAESLKHPQRQPTKIPPAISGGILALVTIVLVTTLVLTTLLLTSAPLLPNLSDDNGLHGSRDVVTSISIYNHSETYQPVIVYIYAPTFPWIEQRAFADLLRRDNANKTRTVYRWRRRSVSIFEQDLMRVKLAHDSASFMLVCDLKCEEEWESWIQANSAWTRQHMGLIHFSDENNGSDYPSRMYNRFSFVFRNYVRPDTQQDLLYTIKGQSCHQDQSLFDETIDWNRLALLTVTLWTRSGVDDCPDLSMVHWRSGFPVSHVHNMSLTEQMYSEFVSVSTDKKMEFHERVLHCWTPTKSEDINASPVNHLVTDSLVSWFPLGYGTDVMIDSIVQNNLPTSQRPLQFGWAGDVAFKPERVIAMDGMVQATTVSTAEAVKKLFTDEVIILRAQGFHQPMVELLFYTQLFLDSRYLPTPAGGSPEQFRI